MSKRIFAHIITVLLSLWVSTAGLAQQGKPITMEVKSMPFAAFAAKVEAEYGYRFFFRMEQVDTLQVSVAVVAMPLQEVLQGLLKGTALNFAIDRQNRVYITHGTVIQTEIPEQFFQRTAQGKQAEKVRTLAAADVNQPGTLQTITIGDPDKPQRSRTALTGYVRQRRNGEGLPGALLYLDSSQSTIATDAFGYYRLSLAPGLHKLRVTSSGNKDTLVVLQVLGDGQLNIDMDEQVSSLQGVTLYSSRTTNMRSVQMGVEKLSARTIQKVPTVMGEVDVLRVILALPGVTSVGEASTGFNVRGGAASQNLMLYDGATIYNPAHLFGFFSAYNPDMIKGVDLYKGFIPEKYGGRISSVLDVSTREGNLKKVGGSVGAGLLTSKFSLEGPIVKDKTSFLIGGRTTYSNWLLKELKQSAYNRSAASFMDADLHLQHKANDKNTFYLTGYLSQDGFRLNNDTGYAYGNRNINVKWKRIFSSRLTGLLTLGWDRYGYKVASEQNDVNGFELGFDIRQQVLRTDFSFTPNNKHNISFGVNAVAYKLEPGTLKPKGGLSLVAPQQVNTERAVESAVYVGDQFTVNNKLSVSGGLRYSLYQYLGPQTIYNYVPGLPKSGNTVADSIEVGRNKTIQNWGGPEVRISARYNLGSQVSVKAGINTLRQYLHMLSNTAAISPVDVWKLSDRHIRPQQSTQYTLGLYHAAKNGKVETSLEVYYRSIRHFLDYKSGARLILNQHIERDVFNTRGLAYGAEIMIRKPVGKLNGWIAYTLSRSQLRQADSLAGEKINAGKAYPTDFDKPHNLNTVANFRFSHRLSISMNLVYNSGRPITLPIGVFELGGATRLLYGDRNAHRIPDYFRMDFSINLDGNHRITKKTHNSWTLGAYNLTGRKNVYSVYFVQEAGKINGYQLSIFGTIIPFITYNIKF